MRRHYILIAVAALIAIHPLIVHGCSCGHDFTFHIESWLDAASQLRHLHYPHWDSSAAYNSGEPRFLFYPPLSWLAGALLISIFPPNAAPIVFTFLAITAAGFSMNHLARHFVSPNAALVAALLYLANPYMLFNAFERTAFAELLAAAWIPLLFLAVLRDRPTARGIAIPLALLWLTNAPAAVMGTYTFALLGLARIYLSYRHPRSKPASPVGPTSPWQLTATLLGGFALGLALPAFYLIPAAYERRYVQIAMAIIPNMRFQDNFLFGHTADAPHNTVLHTVSILAVVLLVVSAIAVIATLLLRERAKGDVKRKGAPAFLVVIPEGDLLLVLATLTILIAFLLTPISTVLWQHLPELAFLQFPWRLLTILCTVLAFSLALLFGHFLRTNTNTNTNTTQQTRALTLATICVLALTALCAHLYRQGCEAADYPAYAANLLRTHHGFPPTDEYTPGDADNDDLRSDNPAWWLTPDPLAYAPNTFPNPNETNPNYDGSIPVEHTVSTAAPTDLALTLPQPETLVLNLRDFHDWTVTDTVPGSNSRITPPHLRRDDGLLAIALPAGASIIDIHWQQTPDQQLGLAITALALLAFGLTFLPSRKINP